MARRSVGYNPRSLNRRCALQSINRLGGQLVRAVLPDSQRDRADVGRNAEQLTVAAAFHGGKVAVHWPRLRD
jgi:hypothetical protein